MSSQNLILPSENRAEFEALLAGLRTEYGPETEQQKLFVEQLAIAHWSLRRRQRAYNAIESSIYEAIGDEPEALTEEHFRHLALAERYRVAAERALKRALTNAESILKQRASERKDADRQARCQAQRELLERRLALAKQKLQTRRAEQPQPIPVPQWPDKIVGRPIPQEMRDQAIADAKAHWDRISRGRE